MSDSIDEKDIWNIIGNFFEKKGLVYQQIEHFNYYINHGIQSVIDEEADIEIVPQKGQKYVVHFGDIYVMPPGIIEDDRSLKLIYPAEARRRDLNYDSSICCDITETLYEDDKIIEQTEHHRITIGRTPIMLRSDICNLTNLSKEERIKKGECEYDSGGYFIIKGNERVLVAQIRANHNQPFVLKQKESDKYSYIAKMRSMSEVTGHSIQFQAMLGMDEKTIVFSLPYIKEVIPVGIVFKALGFVDEDIVNFISLDSDKIKIHIRTIIRDSFFIQSQEEALSYIGDYAIHTIPKEKRIAYAKQVCETELFPHMGIGSSNKEIAIILGHIINQLLSTYIGLRSPDDLDNYANKRIETSGILCTELFGTLFKRYINTIKLQLDKKKSRLDALSIIRKSNCITQGLRHCWATGNWGVQKNAYIRTGVSQVMSRMTYGATLSHLRRIIIPIGKEGKNAKIRQIHPSQFGYICPVETPEGKSSGIVLNFSLLSRVTKKVSTALVREVLEELDMIIPIVNIKINQLKNLTHIFLNGILIGMTQQPDTLVEEIIKLRHNRRLDSDISVTYDTIDEVVKVYCDGGRGSRPLFTIGKDGLNIKKSSGYKWNKLVKKNLIEYVDTSEIENYVIAMKPENIDKWKNDYCEIHPSMLHGVMAGAIPFPDHSPSPRNCYQCLVPTEVVVMADNSLKQIGDIIIGDKVVTINPVTKVQSITTVVNHYIRKNQKPIIKIVTETGRKIKCTEDHLLLTSQGWVEAKYAKDVFIVFSKLMDEYNKYISYSISDFYLSFQEWIKDKIIVNNSICMSITSKIPQKDGMVCDITTKSENHSFIAGDSFCVHNCSMGKQALGMYALTYQQRTDTIVHVLDYPQKPLVSTKPAKFMGFDDMPCGINAVVAITTYMGYNQEDSVMLNGGSIDRGMFHTTSYRTITDTEKKCGMYIFETIGLPPKSTTDIKPDQAGFFRRKNGNFSLLDERGIVRKGIMVKKGDFVIGKYTTKSDKSSGIEIKTDCSVCIKQGEEGIIDMVDVTTTPNGYTMVKIKIRQHRIPEIGDKFASRSAQKGTAGAILRQEDMPFNSDGISPDIIINPHAIPSRMTVNQLMECVLGKACAINGTFGDSTPFTESSTDNAAERICELLASAGMKQQTAYDRTGWEMLYNGMTGEPIKAKVFMGPTYYQRLKHMVQDKEHSRATGHVTTLTRQPLEGKVSEQPLYLLVSLLKLKLKVWFFIIVIIQ